MEYQKTINLLDNTTNQQIMAKIYQLEIMMVILLNLMVLMLLIHLFLTQK